MAAVSFLFSLQMQQLVKRFIATGVFSSFLLSIVLQKKFLAVLNAKTLRLDKISIGQKSVLVRADDNLLA